MRSRFWALMVASVLAVALGVVMRWPEFIGGAIGLGTLALIGIVLAQPPQAARWWDIDVPFRVARLDFAEVRIGVSIDGDSTWVSARDASGLGEGPLDDEASWPIDTQTRGVRDAGPVVLVFADPLGLRSRALAEREASSVLVVPRLHQVAAVATEPVGEGLLAESLGTEHFHALREYVDGDPLRAVHWLTSARFGSLVVRQTVDTREPGVLVVLDADPRSYDRTGSTFADFDPKSFEEAVDLAASACWANAAAGHRVLLTTTAPSASTVPVVSRTRERARDWLALTDPHPAALLGRAASTARREHVSSIVFITGPAGRISGARVAGTLASVTVMRAS